MFESIRNVKQKVEVILFALYCTGKKSQKSLFFLHPLYFFSLTVVSLCVLSYNKL